MAELRLGHSSKDFIVNITRPLTPAPVLLSFQVEAGDVDAEASLPLHLFEYVEQFRRDRSVDCSLLYKRLACLSKQHIVEADGRLLKVRLLSEPYPTLNLVIDQFIGFEDGGKIVPYAEIDAQGRVPAWFHQARLSVYKNMVTTVYALISVNGEIKEIRTDTDWKPFHTGFADLG